MKFPSNCLLREFSSRFSLNFGDGAGSCIELSLDAEEEWSFGALEVRGISSSDTSSFFFFLLFRLERLIASSSSSSS